jgi:pimeloyl-ACP methyl ester carboxylesterase
VVRFDARGFGGLAAGDGLLTMERIADDAAGAARSPADRGGHVCGLSMGGYAAFAFARNHPTRLRGLVLADTKASADSDQARRVRASRRTRCARRGRRPSWTRSCPSSSGKTSHEQRPQVVARVRDLILANPPRGVTDALAGLAARADSTPTLREIRVPTLVVCGEEDAITPPAESEALHAAIKDSTLELIPKAGHLANLEARTRSTARWRLSGRGWADGSGGAGASARRTCRCRSELLATACPVSRKRGPPSKSVKRPPASSTRTLRAAMSHGRTPASSQASARPLRSWMQPATSP